MKDLEINKIAASVLLAGIVAMVAGIGSQMLYYGPEKAGGVEEAKRGYTIEGAESADVGAAPMAEAGPVDILPFLAKADLAAGEKLVKRCTTCHSLEKGGKNGVGPNQWGLVGGKIAHSEGYAYSEALKARSAEKWDFQLLSEFLANPKKTIPGNKMSFAGLSKPEDRANLIAYLNTLSDSPQPLPQ